MPKKKSLPSQGANRNKAAPRAKKRDAIAAEIGDRITEARRRARITTIAALHKLTAHVDREKKGISQPVLKSYEDGQFRPGARELKLLSLALSMSPNWLLFGKENPLEQDASPTPPSSLADLVEITPEDRRGALIGILVSQLKKPERDAWLSVIEATIRSRLGDARFAAQLAAVQTVTDLITSPTGIGPVIFEILEKNLPPEKLAEIGEAFKQKFMELGIPLDSLEDPSSSQPAEK